MRSRSVIHCTCGDESTAHRQPAASNAAPMRAAVLPLPLEPATCTCLYWRCGWPISSRRSAHGWAVAIDAIIVRLLRSQSLSASILRSACRRRTDAAISAEPAPPWVGCGMWSPS
eukprot:scaffold105950_cov35-Tisochrysis_lutea.AAC.1